LHNEPWSVLFEFYIVKYYSPISRSRFDIIFQLHVIISSSATVVHKIDVIW
uniref:Ovule protein n=1 Tax=Haemonchus placei TaxID=6290 RepID=A0A158QL66_HAEPC